MTIQPTRVQPLNDKEASGGRYVLYWMQQAQREEYNHALEYAVRQANEMGLPVVVAFGLTDSFPEATLRHYRFLLEGLAGTAAALDERGIRLVVRHGSPPEVALALADEAALLVTDRGYLRLQKEWRGQVARSAKCRVVQVETDVVVPVDVASEKEEYAARTIRPKLNRHLDDYLEPLRRTPVENESSGLDFDGLDPGEIDRVLAGLDIDRSVGPSPVFRGGTREAKRRLKAFIADKLTNYGTQSSDPAADCVSHMSPYLHFGQVSPLYIALRVLRADCRALESRDAYLEQLIVRRELSMNFVEFNPDYDRYDAVPDWARETLAEHAADERDYVYSADELERAETHDRYWNAAQREMTLTGKMHNYMRMYWGKKIIEWTETPEEAFRIVLALNNKYELDGRDANGFTGVAWCFGKHDRAWAERAIFGKVRYMSARGLERKFDIESYADRIEARAARC